MKQENDLSISVNPMITRSTHKSNWLYYCHKQWNSSVKQGADCETGHELLMCMFQVKVKEESQPVSMIWSGIYIIFKNNFRNCFEILNLIDRNKGNYVIISNKLFEINVERLPKTKKQKKANGMLKKTVKLSRREDQNKEFQIAVRRYLKKYYNNICKDIEEGNKLGKAKIVLQNISDLKEDFNRLVC